MKYLLILKKVFTVDKRSIALMRILIAALVLLDLGIRATDLKAHYSDEGVLPLKVLFEHNWNEWNLSIHNISGMWQVQAVLFSIAAFFAFSLMIGWKTRLSSVITWFLLMSLHYRNPLILQGGDDLLRMTLFWGMFMPWGAFYSIDAIDKKRISGEPLTYFGMATAGYMMQLFCVYFFSAILKSSAEWTTQGTAVYYALSLDQMVFPIGKFLYQFPELLKVLTFSVYYTELLVPFVLFLPGWNYVFRKIFILVFLLLHIGIASTLFVGLFFLIGIAAMAGLLPSSWMNWLELKLFHKLHNPGLKFGQSIADFIQVQVKLKPFAGLSTLKNCFLSCILIFILVWNIQLSTQLEIPVSNNVRGSAQMLGVIQNWGMFAPAVFKDDGWYVFEATTENNRLIDIGRKGKPVDYNKPESVVSLIKNDRWRKFTENYLFVSHNYMRPYYCNFKFNEWNNDHPESRIKNLKIIYMKEVTKPDYQAVQPTREVLSWINVQPAIANQ